MRNAEVRMQNAEEKRMTSVSNGRGGDPGQDPLDAVTVSCLGGGEDHAPFARFRHGIFRDGGGKPSSS